MGEAEDGTIQITHDHSHDTGLFHDHATTNDDPQGSTLAQSGQGDTKQGGETERTNPGYNDRPHPANTPLHEDPLPSSGSSFGGFRTASKKPVAVSEKSMAAARKIMDSVKVPDEPDPPPTIQPSFGGFTTAGKRPVVISDESRKKAATMLAKDTVPEKGEESVEQVIASPPPAFSGFMTAGKRPVVISEESRKKAGSMLAKDNEDDGAKGQDDSPPSPRPMGGFMTAGKRPVVISEESRKKANTLLTKEEEDGGAKTKVESAPSAPPPSRPSGGFMTAGKRPVAISEESRKRANTLLAKDDGDAPSNPDDMIQDSNALDGHDDNDDDDVAGLLALGEASTQDDEREDADMITPHTAHQTSPMHSQDSHSHPPSIATNSTSTSSSTPLSSRTRVVGARSSSKPSATNHVRGRGPYRMPLQTTPIKSAPPSSSLALTPATPNPPKSDFPIPDPITCGPPIPFRLPNDDHGSVPALTMPSGSLVDLHARRQSKTATLKETFSPPREFGFIELLALGVRGSTVDIDSSNASQYVFKQWHNPPFEFLRSFTEYDTGAFAQALIASGATPSLVKKEWVYNHYGWIVWCLAVKEITFPHELGGRWLTPDRVLDKLKYRYEKEINRAQRPALRKILEQDESDKRCMILCVSAIRSLGKETDPVVKPDTPPVPSDAPADQNTAAPSDSGEPTATIQVRCHCKIFFVVYAFYSLAGDGWVVRHRRCSGSWSYSSCAPTADCCWDEDTCVWRSGARLGAACDSSGGNRVYHVEVAV
eukprot:TRINITY_DN4663_c2_g1_i1.p2 TRINITY_DN4663_c2_g1~~TRINITY_DN4663_c2_g1_i1.p2  ORF type:complete len:766 (+),score=154.12 TRINITY_DN4663_c2_g1_i1:16-2313(+)